MLKVIVGRSGTGKTHAMIEKIKEDTRSNVKHIILTPDQCSHQVERALCKQGGASITQKAEVISFSRLCNHIFYHCGGLEEPELTKEGRILLLYRSVEEAKKQENGLRVLSSYTQQPVFFEKLLKTVDELKSNHVSTEMLLDLETQNEKMREIALVCGYYDCFTQSLQEDQRKNIAQVLGLDIDTLETDFLPEEKVLFDPRDRLTRVAEKMVDASKSLGGVLWGKSKVFWLDGFADFTPQQLGIIRCFMEQGEEVTVNLLGDMEDMTAVLTKGQAIDYEEQLFAPMLKTAKTLQRLSDVTKVPFQLEDVRNYNEGERCGRTGMLQHLEAQLFSKEKIPYQNQENKDGSVQVNIAQNTRSEVEWVASEVLRLVKEQGYHYRDIMVVARNFTNYQSLVQSIFKRYEIPVFNTRNADILDKPVISVVNTMFSVINNRFQYMDMFRFLKTGFSSLSMQEVDTLEEYILRWNIQGAQWESGFYKHPYGFRSMEQTGEKQLKRLNAMREKVMEPFQKLPKPQEFVSVAEHCEKLYEFLQSINLFGKMEYRKEHFAKENDLLQSQEYGQLWEILCGCLEQCHRLLGDKKVQFQEFSKVFYLMLSQCSVSAIPATLDQVMAGETTRLKHHRCKVVFWLGAENHSVPMVSNSGGLFTDADRKALEEMGGEKGTPVVLNQTEEMLLHREITTAYEICALATEKLWVSYPKISLSGGSNSPSFLVEDLVVMFGDIIKKEPEDGSFRLLAPSSALDHSYDFPFVTELLKKEPEWQDIVNRLEESKQFTWSSLSSSGVAQLYGEKVSMSATRLQKLKSCEFAHFMQYGLRAKPRREAKFDAMEYGTLVHSVFQVLLQERVGKEGTMSPKEIEVMIGKVPTILEKYLKNQGKVLRESERTNYLFQRLENDVVFMVKNCCDELNGGTFAYIAGEYHFTETDETLCGKTRADGIKVEYNGSIDRIDGWVYEPDSEEELSGSRRKMEGEQRENEETPSLFGADLSKAANFLRVVDYKTGKKDVSLLEFFMGLDLQLPLYYIVAQHKGKDLFGNVDLYGVNDEPLPKEYKENPVYGAAFSYYPAQEVVVRGTYQMFVGEIEEEHIKALRRKGIYEQRDCSILAMDQGLQTLPLNFNKDGIIVSPSKLDNAKGQNLLSGVAMKYLLDAVKEHLWSASEQLEQGNVLENPYKMDKSSPCNYCDYKGACFFDEGPHGENYRGCKEAEEQMYQCVSGIVAAANAEKAKKLAEKEAKEAEKLAKAAEREAAKQAKEAEKLAKVAEREAAKQAKEAEKLAKAAEREVAKQAKEAEKLAKVAEREAIKQVKEAEKLAKAAEREAAKQAKEAKNTVNEVKE